jgi:diguanylate cyclase
VSVQIVLSSDVGMMVNKIMSKLTLVIMAGILLAILYAAYHKVHCAKLVLLGVSTIILAMLARFYLKDFSPFLQRYGLIIAVTIEALIFAFAAAQKVKKLDDDRMAAFKRAATDPLCHILNRDGWEGAAKVLLDDFNRQGGYITLMFIDVDNFKRINDSFGHQSGDDVLRILAKILKRQCREQDVVGRLGGDEFVVLSYCHSRSQSERLVGRIKARLSNLTIQTPNAPIPVTASVGGVITDTSCKNLEALLQEADILMYEQKKAHHTEVSQPI